MKKRIITIALVLALVATCFGGTYAYLQDSKAVQNTFTTGQVHITLDEAKVEQDSTGNWVKDLDSEGKEQRITATKDQTTGNAYHLLPNMTAVKDPTITLNAGSEKAYVAAKITVKGDLLSLIPMDNSATMININAVADGGLLDEATSYGDYNGLAVFQNDRYAVYQVAEGNNTWTLYIFMKDVQTANTKIVLFDTLKVPEEWGNEDMAKINGMTIDVVAFAAQAHGFTDCYTAMTTAFETEFTFAP